LFYEAKGRLRNRSDAALVNDGLSESLKVVVALNLAVSLSLNLLPFHYFAFFIIISKEASQMQTTNGGRL
jgi:hypothetical protein